MDEIIHRFLRETGPVLCLDIGSGTQDALLARPGLEYENWPRFVLPSPARLVAQRIRELTEKNATLEIEKIKLEAKRCDVRGCSGRKPPSDY